MELLPLAADTPHFRAATDLYGTIHGEPVEAVRERFRTHTEREGYRGFVAIGTSGHVVGFTYGHVSRTGQQYHDRLRAAVTDETYTRWLTDAFELVELGVEASQRRTGLGSALHDELFGGVGRATGVLTTESENAPARAFYEGHGWGVIHEPFHVADTEMAVYGRDLN
ncbi:GNAT family N-acetyltransferase [Halorarius litoreus]|uniref:GNAT family N-acetyltransferase n=1 Tax=Halorarius litoreus TaxID=2962676 RepID=UPI0020CBCD44|nr:GNAT family N-acetyltransferase [Halorarius litoreus]